MSNFNFHWTKTWPPTQAFFFFVGREEIRAPLKLPAWEANKNLAPE